MARYRQASASGPNSDAYQNKILLCQAAGRMLSGANPIATWQILRKCTRMAGEGEGMGEQDKVKLTDLVRLHGSVLKH